MSQSITIPSADTLRTMIADMESTCDQVLMQYERNIDANPGDGQVEDQADTIKKFKETLRTWEVKFKTDFEPGEDQPTQRQEEARSSLKYMGESNNTLPKAVYVTMYRPQGVRQDPLDPRFDLEKHSPNGFDWGHPGSGAAQLALAILAPPHGKRQLRPGLPPGLQAGRHKQAALQYPMDHGGRAGDRMGQGPPARISPGIPGNRKIEIQQPRPAAIHGQRPQAQ